jgi:hypothetical protein
MKKLITLTLTVAILLSCMTLNIFAEDSTTTEQASQQMNITVDNTKQELTVTVGKDTKTFKGFVNKKGRTSMTGTQQDFTDFLNMLDLIYQKDSPASVTCQPPIAFITESRLVMNFENELLIFYENCLYDNANQEIPYPEDTSFSYSQKPDYTQSVFTIPLRLTLDRLGFNAEWKENGNITITGGLDYYFYK